jgi:ubiquinone/menaquinone biosynthesis C-methylase UbiE
MDLKQIQQRYAGKASAEWDRLLSTPITRVEHMITRHFLERYLPDTGLILDAGSGPGRYTIDLARQGYRVIMFDLVHEMLELGRAKVAEAGVSDQVVSPVEGNICAMPFAEGAFDAAVSLGAPLSHLIEDKARSQAVMEMARVVKPGGWALLTGVTRLAAYRSAIYWPDWEFFDQFLVSEVRASGIAQGSQTWYNFATGELEDLVQRAGLQVIDCVGCEGIAAHLPMEHLEQVEADPKRWPVWREILLETCNNPTIIGVSNHLLVVARKPVKRV